ncbi:MAG: chemotaxis protein CheW [Spirochaetes bacterium]|nr:chemotaxis protein CheW [Spirochaetota bacterium]MBU0956317.1 chemotaxis protein CheW [Spirochaetota bacterium]
MEEKEENQYLTFGIDGDLFAIPVAKVQEVLEYIKPTRLPKSLAYLKGLINVRGTGIPVIDLRARFGLCELELTRDTSIIVMEIQQAGGDLLVIGALTDEVYEVVNLDQSQLEAAPRLGSKIDADFIQAIGKKDDKFIVIIDVDKILKEDETLELTRAAAS